MKLTKIPSPLRRYYTLSSLVYTLLRLLAMASPLLMKFIVDDAIPSRSIFQVFTYIALFCAIPVVTTLVDVLYFRWINGIVWKLSLAINYKVFANTVERPLSYFADKDYGELLNLYKSDVTMLYSYYLIERPKRAAQGVGALLVLCSLYLLSPILALIQIGLIPLILFPTRAIFKRVSNLSRDIFKNNGRRMGLVSECLRNIKSVKVNLFASFYTHRLQSLHEELVAVWKKVFTYDILTSAWGSSLIGPLSLAISFSYSVYAIMENRMTIGALILVISYTPVFCNFLVSYASTHVRLANKNEEFTRVIQLSNDEKTPDLKPKINITSIEQLDFQNVSFAYGEKPLFKALSFSLHKGDVLNIRGANGAGKSTVLDLLIGLRPPTDGCISVNGSPIDEIDLESYYRRAAYMLQDVELPTLSLRAYFKLHNPKVDDDAILDALTKVNIDVDALLLKQGLDTTIQTTVSNFSGGEKRKLLLAALLLKDSDMLLLDEFTANADQLSVETIKVFLKALVAKKEKILVLVSHDTDFSDIADMTIDLVAPDKGAQ